jgi:hypothetical protein
MASDDTVLLVRVTHDGETSCQWMPAMLAVALLGDDPENGEMWAEGWINADGCDMGAWDRSA